jgi:acetoacetate decarboxylase
MFHIDPNGSYLMPAHFGPRHIGGKASGWYRDVTMMVVSYLTDADKLAAYLPAPFEVAEEALITVAYACNREVDWLAGHGYNLIAVNAAAIYRGEKEQVEGSYTLVMWENLADPILSGRELTGIPKVYADIPDHSVIADEWRCHASHFGHKIVDMTIDGLRTPTQAEAEAAEAAQQGKDNPMGWRYLPGVGGFGTAVSEITTFPSENVYTEAQVGNGTVDWQQLTWEQNPTQYHIVNALAGLPILEYRPALVTRGSANLVIMERLPRVLG